MASSTPDGTRTASGGFYKTAQSQASINTFADSVVAFLRQSNFKLTFGGKNYALSTDNPRGSSTGTPPTSSTSSSTSSTPPSACTSPEWTAASVYNGGAQVAHNGHKWRAKWWTQGEEPGTTGQWGVWEDQGVC